MAWISKHSVANKPAFGQSQLWYFTFYNFNNVQVWKLLLMNEAVFLRIEILNSTIFCYWPKCLQAAMELKSRKYKIILAQIYESLHTAWKCTEQFFIQSMQTDPVWLDGLIWCTQWLSRDLFWKTLISIHNSQFQIRKVG